MNKMIKLTALLLLVVVCIGVLASCGAISYQKRLEDAGYQVVKTAKEEIKEINKDEKNPYKYKAFVYGETLDDNVTVVKLASAKQAKQLGSEFKGSPDKFPFVEIKGKFVIFGTEAGVKAAMGR